MNYNINRILVAVDLSETSLNALNTAIALAKRHGAFLEILNVIEPKYQALSENNNHFSRDSLTKTKDIWSALIASIVHAHEIRPQLIQTNGVAYDQILKFARSRSCDLIVMGSNGASGFREEFLGSNTYSVLKFADCPVLSVPPQIKYSGFKKVLYPIRPVSGALRQYQILCHFLTAYTIIDALGISYRNEEKGTDVLSKIADEMRKETERDKVIVQTIWAKGDSVVEEVLNYSAKNFPELIVLTDSLDITAKTGFTGPFMQGIANRSKFPILRIKGIKLNAVV